MKILECVLNIIFPQKCGICGKIGSSICDNCYKSIKRYEIENQHKNLFFVYQYEGIIRKLIINYKFNDCSYLYKTFEKCLIDNKNVCQFLNGYDIIIPVPLHKKRLRKRGYNQAELIARELAKDINDNANKKYILDKNDKVKYIQNKNIILLNNVLIKNTNIKPQSEKGINQRKTDVRGIYEVNNINSIKDKRIVLFDDIYTTGSTAGECKRVLLEAGALDVGILALAKDYIE